VIEVTEGNRTPWSVRFALPAQAMPSLAGLTPQHSAPVRRRGPVDPMGTPFADVPLSLSALLVDVAMPLSAISALEIGQVLNLPITRNVPLRAGEHTLAHGAIGAVDDCVALQISQLS